VHVLVVGGAGYIGSHMVKRLARAGCRVTTLDDLSTGHADAVVAGAFVRGDVGNCALLADLFARTPFDAVFHFASRIQVGESVARPALYYEVNVARTLRLLKAMAEHGVRHFIFSSSAAVYGMPATAFIEESHPKSPINPYGRTKLMIEQALPDFAAAYGMKYACLRYFNAAGADPEGQLGERHDPETHLIPLVLMAASGRSPEFTVYGRDYDTPDGTCVRDYVHVSDLCDAHWLALQRIVQGGESGCFNLGSGMGYSVAEIVQAATRVSGRPIRTIEGSRRAGDPGRLVAASALARRELHWQPAYEDIECIIEHAWRWEQTLAMASCQG
jgi:UDP-glucose 4-epimerase